MRIAVGIASHPGKGLTARTPDEQFDPVAWRADPIFVDPAAQVRELLGKPPSPAAVFDARRLVVLDAGPDSEAQREPPD